MAVVHQDDEPIASPNRYFLQGAVNGACKGGVMTQRDEDRLLPMGNMPAFAGMWSVVVLVVLTTAVCM